MYKSFRVRNFRCLEALTVDSLERFNLIAGANNVGKTTLIEALFIHVGAYNPALSFNIMNFRGIPGVKFEFGSSESPWDSFFTRLDNLKVIELVGNGRSMRLRVVRDPGLTGLTELIRSSWTETDELRHSTEPTGLLSSLSTAKVLELEYSEGQRAGRHFLIIDRSGARVEPVPPPPPFPSFILGARVRPSLAEQAERYSNLERMGHHDGVLQALRVIEPRLTRLGWHLPADQAPVLCGDIGFGLLPLQFMGGGMVCLAEIAIHVASAGGGVLLIDELENGLHHSVLPKVWSVIAESARQFNTQVFATTHSLECIVAAQGAFAEAEPNDFRLHRLEQVAGETRVVTYDPETLAAAIDLGLEVR